MARRVHLVLVLAVAVGAGKPASHPQGRKSTAKMLQRSMRQDPNPDGVWSNPDPNSGRGANPLRDVPIVGSHFEVQPVSTAMKCVLGLAVQYLLVYTALAVSRCYANWMNVKFCDVMSFRIFSSAALTVNYAPMLAVLFLACRMRVLYQTQGKGNPPEWMQMCMYMCTYSVLFATLTVCTIPVFTGDVIGVDKKTGDIKPDAKPFQNWMLAGIFTAIKFLLLVFLYGGMAAVVYGLVTYQPPAGTWPAGQEPGVSPSVQCTSILACQFFLVYLLLQCARSYAQFSGAICAKFEEAMEVAALTMNYAPMLAILFMAARMRSLQMDPVWGRPQASVDKWFYICTGAVAVQTVLAAAVILVMKGEKVVEPEKPEGEAKEEAKDEENGDETPPMGHEIQYEVKNYKLGLCVIFFRYAIMIGIYVGIGFVIYSILTIPHRDGPTKTPPISVTLQCVICLVFHFFFIYFMVSICHTVKEITGKECKTFTQTMEAARGTVQLAPMLAIVFVAVRIRSLQMTKGRGAPQGWAQDAMFLAVWMVFSQFALCLMEPCWAGAPDALDASGNLVGRPKSKILWIGFTFGKWVCWLGLYGSIVAIIYAVFTMSPENANGRGSLPLVGDGRVPGTEVQMGKGIEEPLGPNDALDKVRDSFFEKFTREGPYEGVYF